MGRHAKVTLRRGNDIYAVHDDKVVERLLFMDGNIDAEDCITKLHKAALERVEKALHAQFQGLGAAASRLKPRLQEEDRCYVKKLRSLGDAFALVRHVTSIGMANWLAELDLALGRLGIDDGGNSMDMGKGNDKDDTGMGAVAVVGSKPSRSARREAAQLRKLANVDKAPLELTDEWADDRPRARGHERESSGSSTRDKGKRLLEAKSSRDRSPHRAAAVASAAGVLFTTQVSPTGSKVKVCGLQSRPELRGVRAVILDFDPECDWYGIEVETLSEKIRVKSSNLKASLF